MVIWFARHIDFLFWAPVLRRVLLNYRCLSVRPSIWYFSLFFMIFGTMVDNWNNLKADSPFFFRAINFCPNYGPKCCQAIILQDSLECNISGRKWMMKFIFGMQINMEVFHNLLLLFWVCVIRHAQSAKIRSLHIFAISPKKHGVWNCFFLPANK